MGFVTAALLILLYDCACATQFSASLNMGGVTGQVLFDNTSQMATLNISGAGSCSSLNLSITVFPVMYGHFAQPCSETHIGQRIFSFTADNPNSVVNVSQLFSLQSSLDDYSLVLRTCNGTEVCTVVSRGQKLFTRQARFTGSIVGNVYLRYSPALPNQWLLFDLAKNTSGFFSADGTCDTMYSLTPTVDLNSSLTMQPKKIRRDMENFNISMESFVVKDGERYECAKVYDLPEKQVNAMFNMRGIKGYFSFRQDSPFSVTELMVNLTNLQSKVGSYHVHLFPVPSVRNPFSSICSNDNVGGHWNPFGLDTNDPAYPKGPGSTHDKYELGDLSTKHMSLSGKNTSEGVFTDYNLPLYGQNSIVGRSVVIHQLDGSRYACASISYPGEVDVAKARFFSPVIGEAWFTQLKNYPLSDLSIFLYLSNGNPAAKSTKNHNWHFHSYPISSERDDFDGRCTTTGGHWNPFKVDTELPSYSEFCNSANPLFCEVGDLSGKHTTVNLGMNPSGVEAKYFFTDVTSWMAGIVGRSIVIHQEKNGGPRIACANITVVRSPQTTLGTWHGPATSDGQIQLSQSHPQGPTKISVSLTNLSSQAGGYHVHVLPIIPERPDPCSNANIQGHFNPLNWNISNSPPPGMGTLDQYEVGDLSGKFGMLTGLNKLEAVFSDPFLPLTGPNSVVGRSVVVHYINGSRMRCADIKADKDKDGHWAKAKAVFNRTLTGTVTMRQQIFSDGSSMDTTVEVALLSADEVTTRNFSMYITTDQIGEQRCSQNGGLYNPFNMTITSPTCSIYSPLSCPVGEFSMRQSALSLTHRQFFTDSIFPLTGDFTVVRRTLVVKNGDSIIDCADILPESPSAEQSFQKVPQFSRYDFRKRVANVLQLEISQVTILPGSPQSNETCQKVSFMLAADVSPALLESVKTSEKMGPYKETSCLRAAGVLLQPWRLLIAFAAVLLL